jgi:hypothetical protein
MKNTKPCYLFTDSARDFNDIIVWQPDGTVTHIYGKNVESQGRFVGDYTSALTDKAHPRAGLNRMFKIPTLKYIGRL